MNVELENWDNNFAQLKWEKPEKDGGAPILKYVIGLLLFNYSIIILLSFYTFITFNLSLMLKLKN